MELGERQITLKLDSFKWLRCDEATYKPAGGLVGYFGAHYEMDGENTYPNEKRDDVNPYSGYEAFIRLDLKKTDDVENYLATFGSPTGYTDGLYRELNYLGVTTEDLEAAQKKLLVWDDIKSKPSKPRARKNENLKAMIEKTLSPECEVTLGQVPVAEPKTLIDYFMIVAYLKNYQDDIFLEHNIFCAFDEECYELVGPVIGNRSDNIYCDYHKTVRHRKQQADLKALKKTLSKNKHYNGDADWEALQEYAEENFKAKWKDTLIKEGEKMFYEYRMFT